jgi:myo-inositol-1(or 4)-monophosphatase
LLIFALFGPPSKSSGTLRISNASGLPTSLIATNYFSIGANTLLDPALVAQIGFSSHGVRSSGSAALDLAYVAAGRLDLMWDFGLKPWDVAAGRLLVVEAGGDCSDICGRPHQLDSSHLVAGPPSLVGAFIRILKPLVRVQDVTHDDKDDSDFETRKLPITR